MSPEPANAPECQHFRSICFQDTAWSHLLDFGRQVANKVSGKEMGIRSVYRVTRTPVHAGIPAALFFYLHACSSAESDA